MIETLLISALIIAIAMIFFLVRVLFTKQGEFKSQHIHDSEAMKERGIHCVMDQDREMRERTLLTKRNRITQNTQITQNNK